MKVLIMSDSHGWKEEIKTVIERHRNDVISVIHCGDSELAENAEQLQDILIVKGNCDRGHFPEEITQDIEGTTFYITHGHLYNVKMTLAPISYRGEEVGAQVVCFGHSHIATSFMENNIVYINPGSLRLPKGIVEQTYALCEIKKGLITVSLYERKTGEEIIKMRKTFELKM